MNDSRSLPQSGISAGSADRFVTVAELVIEDLALSEADLRARVADLEGDVVTYRNLLQVALAVSADLTNDRDRLRSRYHALLDERRRVERRAA